MRCPRFSRSAIRLMFVAACLCVTSLDAVAQTVSLLYSFGSTNDGTLPAAGLIVDSSGNLYGTTPQGGLYGYGIVFELMPAANGGWTEKILHTFNPNGPGADGASPVAGLIFDSSGNLYGTTWDGGATGNGAGTVFELIPQAGGTWYERILYAFPKGSASGQFPASTLVLDKAGNLYGTTEEGGTGTNCGDVGCGVVFELVRGTAESWTEKVLHTFTNDGTDGYFPLASLVFDAAGNLYGTTTSGGTGTNCGSRGCGVVFELSPKGGSWSETILHDFSNNGSDGYGPPNGVVLDSHGNVYGSTQSGGIHNLGVVFELAPKKGGAWTETFPHTFYRGATEGFYPNALSIDAAGNLYGTTRVGGLYLGTAFKLTQTTGRVWNETMLAQFDGTDGNAPVAGVTFDTHGNLYGTTLYGGVNNKGTVFEITP